jgi:hypothetical protein
MTSNRRARMSGNYKARNKSEAEKEYDIEQCIESLDKYLEISKEFFDEFSREEGKAYHCTWVKFMDATHNLSWAEDMKSKPKVGKYHDMNVTGAIYYDDI